MPSSSAPSSSPGPSPASCPRCSAPLEPGALACGQCHTLVHAQDLERLAAEAKALEAQSDPRAAQQRWLEALALLPPESTQADWIRRHARQLAIAAPALPPPRNQWIKKLGPLAPFVLALAKGKALLALLNLKFLLSLAAFVGVYSGLFGARFGIGFAALILIHEMGHFVDVKRRGLPADMPVFLPGLGAYVRWQALGVTAETRAAVSLAGPLAGWLASAGCLFLWWQTGSPIWAALARASAWLNALNLIPVWVLDGGQAARALDQSGRIAVLTTALAMWLLLGQGIFLLVAIGAGYRLFTKDLPPQPSMWITIYFCALMVSLGMVLYLLPPQHR